MRRPISMNTRTDRWPLLLLAFAVLSRPGLAASAATIVNCDPIPSLPINQTLTGTGSGASVTEARQNALSSLAGARAEFRATCRFAGGLEGYSNNTPESGSAAQYTFTQDA